MEVHLLFHKITAGVLELRIIYYLTKMGFSIYNPITHCNSIDLNTTLGFEPMDYLSCFGDGRYCGQFNTFNWPGPGTLSDLCVAIVLMGLYLYFVVLGAFATSDGGKPRYPWLMVSIISVISYT